MDEATLAGIEERAAAATPGPWVLDGHDHPLNGCRCTSLAAAPSGEPKTCIGNDPTCPCQDGDVCHYVDDPETGTKAWSAAASGEQRKEGQR